MELRSQKKIEDQAQLMKGEKEMEHKKEEVKVEPETNEPAVDE